MALVFAGTGCLSRPALVRQMFAFQSPPPAVVPPKAVGILAIRSFQVSPLFASDSLTYRTGAESYEHDPYAGFVEIPETTLKISVRAWLYNSGAFRDVVEPGSLIQPDRFLEVQVSELYGDFREPTRAAAVLSIRFDFFQSGNGTGPAVYLEKNYSRRIELAENSAVSVVAGWDKALAEIMTEVVSDLAATAPK